MRRVVTAVLLGALIPALASAQNSTSSFDEQLDRIPVEYEEIILDLVERYEEARRLLRAEIARNENLFTAEELEAAVAQTEADLGAELISVQTELDELEAAYKVLRTQVKNATDEARAYKDALVKTTTDSESEIATLQQTLDAIEEESILQLGATFSPAGSLGALGIINLPDTNVGLLGGATYRLRERSVEALFGVTLSFLPQQGLVEGWTRLRNRFGNRVTDKPGPAPDPVTPAAPAADATPTAPATSDVPAAAP